MGNVKSQMGDNSKNSEITDCVQLKGHTQHVNVMFFDSASGLLYTGSDDKEIREWDILEKKKMLTKIFRAPRENYMYLY